jgi:hypothetical protein
VVSAMVELLNESVMDVESLEKELEKELEREKA